MNKHMYRLVFSKHLGMMVPASEVARSHVCKGPGSAGRARRRVLATLLAAATMQTSMVMAAPLDGMVPGGGSWTGANAPVINGNQMTIQQVLPKAILNWNQMNLRTNETLNVNMASNWSTLHKIHDMSPTTIAGTINAAGHQYFINTNGIIFGNGAQINVGSLTASSLDITDDLFNSGFLSNPASPVFNGTSGFVFVEEGAAITAATGGRVMLMAPDVENRGVIHTPDGQTILAAGESVFLTDAKDPAGLLVEVVAGGTAKNLGEIVAQRGNVTLVGLAVNQEGRISASTSVRNNGSVHLVARDKTAAVNGVTRRGVVTVAAGSETVIDVETADKEEVLGAQKLNPSRVKLEGGVIDIDGKIVAHGGEVTATVTAPAVGLETSAAVVPVTRIHVGENAVIDVSGVDASAPMSRNQLEIQLYSEQLKDTPILRGGPLFGQKIYVDARKGTDLLDIQPFLDLKGQTIAERNSAGGTVNLNAGAGEVVMAKGATVDISGGSVAYDAGYVRESSLVYDGATVAVSDANKSTPYQGLADVYTVKDPKWGVTRSWNLNPNGKGAYVAAYTEGRDAGTVNITGARNVIGADFKADTKPGFTQRTTAPAGGTFNLTTQTNGLAGFIPSTVRIVEQQTAALPAGFDAVGAFNDGTGKFEAGSALSQALLDETQIDTGIFASGFTQVKIDGVSPIVVDAAINARPDSKLTLTAGQVDVNANISVPSGDITIGGGTVNIADGVRVSAAGLYTNDKPGVAGAQTSPVATDGGNIVISGKTNGGTLPVTLGEGAVIDASAGAWMDEKGKLGKGKAGNITLEGITSIEAGQVQAFGFSKGGTLTLDTMKQVQIGGQPPAGAGTFWLSEAFFNAGGFSKFNVTASADGADLTVASGASIQPHMQTLQAQPGIAALPSGTAMGNVAQATQLPDAQRTPVSIALTANDKLTVEENATIRLDAPGYGVSDRGAISLTSNGQMTILGDLIAPAGSVTARINGNPVSLPYNETLSLFVGENATISTAGHYATALPDGSGQLKASVMNAGNVVLDGGRSMVILKEGSQVDVSGVSGDADIATAAGLTRQTLYGAAGSISVAARNGFVLDGVLNGKAQGTGAGGTLSLRMEGNQTSATDGGGLHPDGAGLMTINQTKVVRAAGLNAGDALSGDVASGFAPVSGRTLIENGAVSVAQIAGGGFDRLEVAVNRSNADDRIILPSGLDLDVPVSVSFTTPQLAVTGNGTARVAASTVTLGGGTATATPGSATLKVDADFIDMVGATVVSGVARTEFSATNDIRGRNASSITAASLTAPGELLLRTRQIYPATASTFNIEATGAGSRIEVQSNGATPKPVLSAAGQLTLTADNILQGGTLKAPLGKITLDAASNLTLAPGSLTSVSTEGQTIPYGVTGLGGLNFDDPTVDNITSISLEQNAGAGLSFNKTVKLDAGVIDLQSGAKVDLSGGGDTLTYEFINGVGGSKDILGQAGVYAIMPAAQGEYAPYDPNFAQVVSATDATKGIPGDLKVGDAVYLSGMPGVKAGVYTLLPGRYALLPGAFMVQTGTSAVLPGQSVAQLDGSTLVSGYRTTLEGSSRDTNFSTYRVTNGNVFREQQGTKDYKGPAEYRLNSGNDLHTRLAQATDQAIPRLASDAGQLVLKTVTSLNLGGELLTGKPAGARGAMVDITADNNKIKVVSTEGAAVAGTVQLKADSLNDLNVESLLLGGTRTQGAAGQVITTTATEVTFANDAAHALEVPELIATAKGTLNVNSGAVINAVADVATTGKQTINASGDGALLAVSAVNDLAFSRTASTGAAGTLNTQAGATINAQRSLVIDSTFAALLAGDANVNDGGSATLGANLIQLGNPATVSGMLVDNALIDSLGDLALVTLNSRQNLEVHGPAALGNNNLDITFNTSGIKGLMAAGEQFDVTANTFTLKNTTGLNAVAAAGNGTLNVNAQQIALEGRAASGTGTPVVGIGGFDTVNLKAAGETRFSGIGEVQINASTTNLTNTRITAASGAVNGIKASGVLNTLATTSAATLAAVNGLGAKLALEGTSVNLGGRIELPSGQLNAVATTGNLEVASGAVIKAGSVPVKFDRVTEHTPGGKISLQSTQGNVNVNAGSTLDVSGSGDADAGKLSVSATNGTANLNGTLLGSAGPDGGRGGKFALDVHTLGDFSALNTSLNTGGFTESRDLRVRTGNVNIASDDTVTSHQFTLSADGGKIDIAGTVNADGNNGGSIALHARDNVTLKSTGQLLARGTGDATVAGDKTTGAGGEVMLSSLSKASVNAVSAEAGALIDVSGDQNGAVHGQKGDVTMRASRGTTGTANTVNVAFGTTAAVKGAETVRLEGTRVYNSATFATNTATIVADTNAFYTANPGAGSYAATQDGATIEVLPNIEVRSTGTTTPTDLTIAADLNMRAFGALQVGKGGTLTLRSNKDLKINGSLSDAFSTATTAGVLQSGKSFSFELVGGADFDAANPLATIRSTTAGDVSLANNKLVRTGTGDISIAAGRDLVMGNEGSVIYTAGRAADALAGFSVPTNALYLTDGGDVDIRAQRNIDGKFLSNEKQQTVNNWLFRQGAGTSRKQVSWWVRPDLFKQGVAALGGGDVNVVADGNISNFSAAVPTTARYVDATNYVIDGGGNVNVSAGGDINSGLYFAGRGDIDIVSGGEIKASSNTFGTTIALQDANVNVSAVRGARIEAAYNPTLWLQGTGNATSALDTTGFISNYLTFSEDSTFRLRSLAGNVTLGTLSGSATGSIAGDVTGLMGTAATQAGLNVYPATVEATAFGGDINLRTLTLAPSANGNLSLLASGNIGMAESKISVTLSDADAALLPNPTRLAGMVASGSALDVMTNAGSAVVTPLQESHAATPVHQGDNTPVQMIARDGSVSIPVAVLSTDNATKISTAKAGLISSKPVYVHAGKDITLSADIQHLADSDMSVIDAGRDFINSGINNPAPGTDTGLRLGGPGELLVQAGRDVNLGITGGIVTVANTVNPNLPAKGASVTVLAGLGEQGADLATYVNDYIDPAGAGPLALRGDAVKMDKYRKATLDALTAYMRTATGNAALTEAQAVTQYLSPDMDQHRQALFAYRHLSSELLASGKSFADTGNNDRGDAAIAALFPNGRAYDGDLSMFNSQIRTLRDGSVDLLAPGGKINVGVSTSSGPDIGVVTELGGAIRAFAESGFQVEMSKVITQFGSDITVWVNNGDIDAGRGSKAAVSIPDRIVSTDKDGNTTIEIKDAAVGSGIRAQAYDPDGPSKPKVKPDEGSVALIAPRGVLNAGEAGIAAGNFLAVATQVIGANNISVSGSSSGVPAADTGSLAGSLAGVSNVASDATKAVSDDVGRQAAQSAAAAFSTKNFLPSFISVEVIGLGD